jgi:hypothetical protein
MREHRLRIGQFVTLRRDLARLAAAGSYEIVGLVPHTDGEPRYRVQSPYEDHARVVDETDLTFSAEAETSGSAGERQSHDISIASAKSAKMTKRRFR